MNCATTSREMRDELWYYEWVSAQSVVVVGTGRRNELCYSGSVWRHCSSTK